MTGQEHYAEAERMLAEAKKIVSEATTNTIDAALEVCASSVAAAQVHATLALVEATRRTHAISYEGATS